MAVRKTYQSLGAIPLSIDIHMGGRLQSVDFTGWMKHPVVVYPKFSTTDETIQRALERYPGYKKSFALVLIETINEQGEITETLDPTGSNSQEPQNEILIKNFGDAKTYLKKEFNILTPSKSKREDVNELFAQKGLKLILETDKKS